MTTLQFQPGAKTPVSDSATVHKRSEKLESPFDNYRTSSSLRTSGSESSLSDIFSQQSTEISSELEELKKLYLDTCGLIHYIWMGSGIDSCPHIQNIEKIKQFGKTILLWVDHITTESKKWASTHNIHVIDINKFKSELFNSIDISMCDVQETIHDIYEEARYRLPPSFAEASDILRYSILYVLGGLYLDCDIVVSINSDQADANIDVGYIDQLMNHELGCPDNNNDILWVKHAKSKVYQELIKTILVYKKHNPYQSKKYEPMRSIITKNVSYVVESTGFDRVYSVFEKYSESNDIVFLKKRSDDSACSWISQFHHWIRREENRLSISNESTQWIQLIEQDIIIQLRRKKGSNGLSVINFAKYELVYLQMNEPEKSQSKRAVFNFVNDLIDNDELNLDFCNVYFFDDEDVCWLGQRYKSPIHDNEKNSFQIYSNKSKQIKWRFHAWDFLSYEEKKKTLTILKQFATECLARKHEIFSKQKKIKHAQEVEAFYRFAYEMHNSSHSLYSSMLLALENKDGDNYHDVIIQCLSDLVFNAKSNAIDMDFKLLERILFYFMINNKYDFLNSFLQYSITQYAKKIDLFRQVITSKDFICVEKKPYINRVYLSIEDSSSLYYSKTPEYNACLLDIFLARFDMQSVSDSDNILDQKTNAFLIQCYEDFEVICDQQGLIPTQFVKPYVK